MKNLVQTWLRRQQAHWRYRRGLSFARKTCYGSAIAAFDQALLGHPQPDRVWVQRGLTHWRWGNLAAAIADFDQAIALNPQNATAYGNRGLLRYQQGDTDAAFLDWAQALHHQPHYAEVYYNRGLALATAQQPTSALADFDQALAANPNLAEAYFQRGLVQARRGDRGAAIKDWELALLNDPGLYQAHQQLAIARADQRNATLTATLQTVLAPNQLTVQAELDDLDLTVAVHHDRGVPINYRTLPDQLRPALIAAVPPHIETFQLVGRVADLPQPEWQQTYRLYAHQPCPPTHWRFALFTTLVAFPPLGMAALAYATQVRRLYRQGNYPAAKRASRAVKGLCVVGSGVLVLMGVILAVFVVGAIATQQPLTWEAPATNPSRRGTPPFSL